MCGASMFLRMPSRGKIKWFIILKSVHRIKLSMTYQLQQDSSWQVCKAGFISPPIAMFFGDDTASRVAILRDPAPILGYFFSYGKLYSIMVWQNLKSLGLCLWEVGLDWSPGYFGHLVVSYRHLQRLYQCWVLRASSLRQILPL